MSKIFVPSSGPGDWRCLLANPQKHWARGYSARTLAHSWEDIDGFPAEISQALSMVPELEEIEPLLMFPEWKVPLPGGSSPSQSDIWMLAKCKAGLVSIAIEGKVEESFDDPLGVWRKNASSGKLKRLKYLLQKLDLQEPISDKIHYQLLHRTASAVIEAQRFNASQSAMLVHSFGSTDQHFKHFQSFVSLYGADIAIGQPCTVKAADNMPLHLCWVHGDKRYLKA
ncbi:MAG: hypothetical protein OXL39_09980 [Caldilineaceae bacterium]|nr:hypothetical protein [Caldilineaceae bacterium]